MDGLSNKAKVIYAALEKLNAYSESCEITSYKLLDYISEDEELNEHPLLKDISEEEFVEIIMDLNLKSINTLIASMCRKDLVIKSDPHSIKIDGERHNLRYYFLKK